MKFIKLYDNFQNESEILYIFDMDQTLVKTPSFEELALEYLMEKNSIKSLIDKSLKWIGAEKKELKWENGRIFIDDKDNKIIPKKNWVKKGNRVYLITPDIFNFMDISLPTELKDISRIYKSVKNKAIVTGRSEDMRDKIIKRLNSLGLEIPNFGLFCYPTRDSNQMRVGVWKAEIIVNLIRDNGFKSARFYEDNSKWLKTVTKMVKDKLPNIEWKGIKVS